jgi:CRISPR-associated Csx2 family protein
MSKLLISFLGTNDYKECEYTYNGEVLKSSRFIQEVLINKFCGDFTAEDRIGIFLTSEAENKNWKTGQNGTGLKDIIASSVNGPQLESIQISDGKSDEEIWQIFTAMFDLIHNEDTVIYDITHGFRSLPLLGFAVLNYAVYLKNIQVGGIYYGAYEARDAENKAPVFDLAPFYTLLRWTSAADAFVNYGISDKLSEVVKESARTFLGSQGMVNSIKYFTDSLMMLRGKEIIEGGMFKACVDKINKIEAKGSLHRAFQPIIERVKEKIDPFKENDPSNFIAAIKWYLRQKMVVQALTMMQEGLITLVMTKKSIDWKDRNKRELIGEYLMYVNKLRYEKGPVSEDDFFDERKIKLLKDLKLKCTDEVFTSLENIYDKIRQLRNDVNHGGFNEQASSVNHLMEKTRDLFEQLCGAIEVL